MAESEIDTLPKPKSGLAAALDGIGGLTVLRQIGLMVGLAASIAIGFGIVLWSQEPSYKPLYTDISHLEAGQVSRLLDQEQIAYKVDTTKGLLLVEASQIHQARIALAEEGFSTGKTMGYELLDKEQPFGTSQFMEKARYHRSIEGELSNTIASMNRVRGARVHLAIPKRSVFVNDRRRPTASVFLEVYRGQSLGKSQVAAIVHLVSSSIPEMNESDVSVVDQRGNLLTEQDKDSEIAMAAKQLDYTRQFEQRMIDRVANILEPIVGPDGFKVQVAADLDFSAREQAAESFNPDLAAVRSEQTLNEVSDRQGVGGVPGALSNQPPGTVSVPEQAGGANGAAANASSNSSANERRQETRNFELDRTVTHTRHQMGSINRLSVAVVLDDRQVLKKDPETNEVVRSSRPLNEAEIERINLLVRNAMGFSAARGDSVSVINQAFNISVDEIPEIPEEQWWRESWVMDYARLGAGVLLLIIFFFGVLRPMFNRLVDDGPDSLQSLGTDMDGLSGMGLEGGEESLDGDDTSVTLSGESANPLLPGPDNNYESNLDSVRGLAAEDPKRVAQAIKMWLNNE